jgi:hypothetical protein
VHINKHRRTGSQNIYNQKRKDYEVIHTCKNVFLTSLAISISACDGESIWNLMNNYYTKLNREDISLKMRNGGNIVIKIMMIVK